MAEEKRTVNLSKQAIHRMPFYQQCLKKLYDEGVSTVSAPVVAEMLKLNEVQVRKDFAAVSTSGGRAKIGFDVAELLDSIEHTLGYRNMDDAVLVGAGSLGHALASFRGFEEYGLRIVAAFDVDEKLIGTTVGNATVYPLDQLTMFCEEHDINIGIITVPVEHAQSACDLLVEGGVLGIWNFAPAYLRVPDDILLQNENMAASLAMLSKHLREKLAK
ncbi:MAG: redox-sensing transcriptional repressor Rex [Clostridia bacterium]|nr:redox-sensing transcriptional repressor Rex [Clostridia bacterium]